MVITSTRLFEAWIERPGPDTGGLTPSARAILAAVPGREERRCARAHDLADLSVDRVGKVPDLVCGEPILGRDADEPVAVARQLRGAVDAPLVEHRLEHRERAAGVRDPEERVVVELRVGCSDEHVRGAHGSVARDGRRSRRLRARAREAPDDRIHRSVDSLVDDPDDHAVAPVSVVPERRDAEELADRVDLDTRPERAAVESRRRAGHVGSDHGLRRLVADVVKRRVPVRKERELGVRPDVNSLLSVQLVDCSRIDARGHHDRGGCHVRVRLRDGERLELGWHVGGGARGADEHRNGDRVIVQLDVDPGDGHEQLLALADGLLLGADRLLELLERLVVGRVHFDQNAHLRHRATSESVLWVNSGPGTS